jgi:predicted DNA-binding transcriptional regulator YafY
MIATPGRTRHHPAMRYGPAERLLRLARHLAGTRTGLTLDEMARQIEGSRRTAERLRDSLIAMFPQMDYWDDEARVRRWRLPGSALVGLVDLRADALAVVETMARECETSGEADRAGLLREVSSTLRALMRPEALRRAEPDIAALMQAEGIAMRPGPRPIIVPGLFPTLRRAILGMHPVAVMYTAADAAAPVSRCLCPHGLLYGGRGWLVAPVEGLPELRLWRLDRIASATLLDRNFTPQEDFDLAAYAAQSFGVFQEAPLDVVLRFTPEAADDAATWLFHPTQTSTRAEDGTLTVRFTAGGVREMCWHLFTWGAAVTVVAPEGLRVAMRAAVEAVSENLANLENIGRANRVA